MSSLVACFSNNSSGGSTTFSNSLNSSYGNFTEATLNEQSVTISRYWLNLFLTVADPGPIDNGDLYCRHRRIRPTEWMFFNSLAVPLIEPVGRLLLALYGGGPTMSRLKIITNIIEGGGDEHGDQTGGDQQPRPASSLANLEDSPICVICSATLNELRERRREEWSRWAMLQSVPGMVFRRLKVRNAKAMIHFEMLEDDEEEKEEKEMEEEMVVDDGESGDEDFSEKENFNDNNAHQNNGSNGKINVDDGEGNDRTADDNEKKGRNGKVDSGDPEIEEAVEVKPSAQNQVMLSNSSGGGELDKRPPPNSSTNLYEEYPIDEEPTTYYLISAEWIQAWFNFVNVDMGADLTSARNRQLMAIYQKITAQESSSQAASTNAYHHHQQQQQQQQNANRSGSPFRHSLNSPESLSAVHCSNFHPGQYQQQQYHQMNPNPNHYHHLPHPPFSSLIRAVGGTGTSSTSTSASSSIKESGSSQSARNLQEQQLWSQLDFHHHTVLPPGPIDNWSLFGIKRKLLTELKKLRQKAANSASKEKTSSSYTFSEPTTYNELATLLAKCLCRGEGERDDDKNDEGEEKNSYQTESTSSLSFKYNFTFAGRLHGGISEENRSCSFYLLSPEYWHLFSTAYGGGGGPVFTFDYRDVEQKFSVHISVADVEHFIRHHFKGGLGGGGSKPNHQISSLLDHQQYFFPMILGNSIEEEGDRDGSTSQQKQKKQARKGSTSIFDSSTKATTSSSTSLRRRRTVSASAAGSK